MRRFRVFSVAALGVKVPPAERLPEPTETHGTLRRGKMAELRLESVFLGIRGEAFCLSFFVAPSPAVSCI